MPSHTDALPNRSMFSGIEAKLQTIGQLHVMLDTCVIALMDESDARKSAQWSKLQGHKLAGRITWGAASRVVQDKEGDPDEQRRLKHLAEVSTCLTPSVFRFDESFLDEDVLDGPHSIAEELEAMWEIHARVPGSKRQIHDLRDIDHAEAAIRACVDALLTIDGKTLSKREIIYERYGLTICTPQEICDIIDANPK